MATRATAITGHVDHQHRAPPEVLEQPAAGHRAEGHGDAGGGGPHGDRRRPLLGDGEDVDEDRQRGGEHQGGADAHRRPPADQLAGAVGRARRGRRTRRTGRGRPASCPCGRSGRRGCRRPSAGRRRRGRRRRRSTAAGWSRRRARVASVGRVTLTIVPSRTTTNTDAQSTARIIQRRRASVGLVAVESRWDGIITVSSRSWNNVITVLSRRDSIVTMTPDTAVRRYGEAGHGVRPPIAARRDDTRQALARRRPRPARHRGSGSADGAPHRRRRRDEHDERVLPVRRQGRRARRAVHRRLPPPRRGDGRAAPTPTTRSPTCAGAARAYRRFAREQPDVLLADVRPRRSPTSSRRRRPRRRRSAPSASSQQRVERAMAAGAIRRGDPFTVATGAVGLRARAASASRRAPPRATHAAFDWDAVARARRRRPATGASPDRSGHRSRSASAAPDAARGERRRLRRRPFQAGAAAVHCDRTATTGSARSPTAPSYGLVADGDGPRFDPSKVLLDPRATRGRGSRPGTTGALASRPRRAERRPGPLAVARAGRRRPQPPRRSSRGPVVYEAHVRGLTRLARRRRSRAPTPRSPSSCRAWPPSASRVARAAAGPPERPAGGQLLGLHAARLRRRRTAGTRPATTPPASSPRSSPPPTTTTSRCGSTSCSTTRPRSTPPGRRTTCAGCPTRSYYRLRRRTARTSRRPGCGNDIDATSPAAQDLVAVVARPARRPRRRRVPVRPRGGPRPRRRVHRPARPVGGGARRADDRRAVGRRRHVPARPGVAGSAAGCSGTTASATTCAGSCGPSEGLVAALQQRVQGSPDLFDSPLHSVNFVACHDGFTLYDLVAYDRKHNEANGHGDRDGAQRQPLVELRLGGRRRACRTRWSSCAGGSCATRGACWPCPTGCRCSRMGDEFGRTQGGNNNAYNQDNETSWVDWERAAGFADLERFVGELLAPAPPPPGALAAGLVGRRRCSGSAPTARPTSARTRGRWPGPSATCT